MGIKNDSKIDTIVGAKSEVQGDIRVEGSLLVSGKVDGNVHATDFIRVTDTAVITGDLETGDAVIAGRIEGNVLCRTKVQLAQSASLLGDLRAARLIIEEGAVFNGTCKMPEDEESGDNTPGEESSAESDRDETTGSSDAREISPQEATG